MTRDITIIPDGQKCAVENVKNFFALSQNLKKEHSIKHLFTIKYLKRIQTDFEAQNWKEN